MSSSHTSHSPDEGPLGYDALDYASIEIVVGGDGQRGRTAITRRLFEEMAERSALTSHIHFTPAMQLTQARWASWWLAGKGGELPATGTEQAFEEVDAYQARRVRDRFTSAMLERYCQALGIAVFDPSFYGPDAVLVESTVPMAPDGMVMTLRQAQAWLEIVPGMADSLPG